MIFFFPLVVIKSFRGLPRIPELHALFYNFVHLDIGNEQERLFDLMKCRTVSQRDLQHITEAPHDKKYEVLGESDA